VRRAPFEVFAPTLAPEGTELHVFYQPASARGVGASVHLAYAHHAHSLSIAESLVADGDYGDTGWEEREHAGRRYLTRDVHGQQHLLVDLGGTRIFMSSGGLGEPALIEVAASLAPASREPPRLVPVP
jgi:hypothetical protein